MAYCKNCGSQIDNRAIICPKCGVPQETKPAVVDNGGFGWGFLGFILPVVALVLFRFWKQTKPNTARVVGIGALVGAIICAVLYIIYFVLLGSIIGIGASIY